MKRKSMITMLVIALMLVLSLTVLSACGKNKDDNKDDPPAKYSVTVTNGTGGGEYAEGATVKIKANAPETGKEFTSWTIEGVTVDDKTKAEITFTMPANEVTATANYGDILYEFALENCTADKESAKFGEEVTFTADEIIGKRFDSWNIKGVDDLTGLDLTKSPLTFTMPANDINVAAVLEDIDYTVTVNGGTANKTTAHYGDTVTIKANAPATGKKFGRWEITGLDTSGLELSNAELTFTMPAKNVTVTALYSYIDYKVTVVGGTAQVDADAEPTGEVWATYECTVSIFADTAPTGKRFVRWTSADGVVFDDARSAETTFTMPAKAVTVTAEFEYIDYEIKVTGGAAQVNDGGPFSTNAAHYGDNVKIKAHNPGIGMKFKNWTITGVDTSELVLTNEELTFTMPANAVTAKANYVYNNYKVTVNGGTANKTTAHYGDSITITAEVPVGKEFVMWSFDGLVPDGLTLTDKELTFTMPANDVTATAELRDLVKRSVTVQGGVAQVGEGTQMTSLKAYCGDTVTLTAYQHTDKTFVKWTIEGIDTEELDLTQRVLTFIMPENNVTATAEFENIPTELTFDGNTATSGELWYVNNDSKSFRLPLGDGQELCTYTIELSNSAFTFKVYGSVGEVIPYDNGDGIMRIDIDAEDNYTIRVVNTGSAANCTLTVTQI